MIEHRLVLVLGAGASRPFGFPTGDELYNSIITELGGKGNGQLYSLLHEAGFEHQEINKFHSALSRAGTQSVDAFLEHRAEFRDVGKAAIASALLRHEHEETVHANNESNWYRYFFEKLNSKFEDFYKNSVSVLTFNYDRSLEHFLYTALINKYGKTPEECVRQVRVFPIIHLYGQLGEFLTCPPKTPPGIIEELR